MPIDRTTLASMVYWRRDPDRQPQRFYIAFCLLMSALQDWALGRKEEREQNLNWSTTCSYYSLVHVGRLLVFLALGDFPTSHAKLRTLLLPGSIELVRSRRQADGYPFDWLREFARARIPDAAAATRTTPVGELADVRRSVIRYLEQIGVGAANERVSRFGSVFATAGPLRTDSNYEALLIAHEYRHMTMSSAFEELARHMGGAAESAMPLAAEVFSRFVMDDPDLSDERQSYQRFANAYLHERMEPAIRRKLSNTPEVEELVARMIQRIQIPDAAADFSHLEQAVSLHIFGNKARLMDGFQRKIEELGLSVAGQVA